MIALYPGSFDPITFGHLDLIKRSCRMFNQVIVLVAQNPDKNYLFTVDERLDLIKQSTQNFKNLDIDWFSGLTVNYAKSRNAGVLIRGLRAVSDFEKELQMAHTNQTLWDEIETVFLATANEYSFLSSSVVKEIASFGGSVQHLVPKVVDLALQDKYQSSL